VENIFPAVSPNLPVGPLEYDQRYQDQLLNVLRLYFNQLDGNNAQIIQAVNGLTTLQWLGSD
jgi:hypothetical protein